jgi:outer membrane receptor protein involved in Fe transport
MRKHVRKVTVALLLAASAVSAQTPATGQDSRQLDEMSLEELLTIDVSVASKKSESLSTTPAIVSSIRADDARAFGIRTLKEALALVPGVVIQDAPVGTTSIMIRGLSETFNQKVLFLLEGVPYWMSSHGDVPLLSLPLESIERIEVIRGPGSVVYGTNASAGVINVILKKGSDRDTVDLSGGSQGLLSGAVSVSRRTAHGHFFVGGSAQSMGDGYEAGWAQTNLVAPFTNGRQFVGAELRGFPTSGSITKKEESKSVVAGFQRGGLTMMGHAFEQTSNGLGGAPLVFQPNRLTYRGLLLHAGWAKKVSHFDLNVYADHNPFFLEFSIDNFLASADSNQVVTARLGRQLYRDPWTNNFRTRLGATASYPVSSRASLLLGVENEVRKAGEYQKTDEARMAQAIQSRTTRVNEFSAFAQVDLALADFRAVLGGRFVDNGLAGTHVSPRVSLIYSLDESRSLKLLFSEGFNSPVISQQDLIIPFVVSGNKDLRAETVRSWDLAYTHSTRSQIMTLNGYVLSVNDAIGRVRPPGAAQPQYANVDGFTRFGFEADYQRSFRNLLLLSNAAFNRQGHELLDDDPLAMFVPKFSASAGARYKLGDGHSVGAAERFWSKRGTIGAQHVTTLDYSYTYKRLRVSAVIDNVFDRPVYSPDVNANTIPSVPSGPGRSFYALCTLSRGN